MAGAAAVGGTPAAGAATLVRWGPPADCVATEGWGSWAGARVELPPLPPPLLLPGSSEAPWWLRAAGRGGGTEAAGGLEEALHARSHAARASARLLSSRRSTSASAAACAARARSYSLSRSFSRANQRSKPSDAAAAAAAPPPPPRAAAAAAAQRRVGDGRRALVRRGLHVIEHPLELVVERLVRVRDAAEGGVGAQLVLGRRSRSSGCQRRQRAARRRA